MESKDILKLLEQFESNDVYKKIFINGKWGIGKSYYVNLYRKNKDDFVYVSLFGMEDVNCIQEAIIKELFKKINSKDKLKKKLEEFAKKIEGSISFYGISINSFTVKTQSFIEEYHSVLNQKLIIVFDDLERKSPKISMEDILGQIEQLSKFEDVKLVLIGDENKIAEGDKKVWNSFKEKIIEKEYYIQNYSKDAINSLVISKLKEYIDENQLKSFLQSFLQDHHVKNLRTINKGVNLFLEIKKQFLKEDFREINFILFKTCISVAVEKLEELYINIENKNDDSNFLLDNDLEFRVARFYFDSYFLINKDACLITYVISIFDGRYDKDMIDEMKRVASEYIQGRNQKDIFYLDEDRIKEIILEKYNSIINDIYDYSALNELLSDTFNILYWSSNLEIEIDELKLKDKFKQILFEKYFNKDNEMSKNYIDKSILKLRNNIILEQFVKEYNIEAERKYYEEKLNDINKTYRNMEFDRKKLRWIDITAIQPDLKNQVDRFIKEAENNNYFISDLTGEIREDEWEWDYCICVILNEYASINDKKKFQKYLNSMKGKNNICDVRIKMLNSMIEVDDDNN